MPVWLAWLLPVPSATLAAVAWNAWSGRERRPLAVAETIAAHERFRAALSTDGATGAPTAAPTTVVVPLTSPPPTAGDPAPSRRAPAQRSPLDDLPQGGPGERTVP